MSKKYSYKKGDYIEDSHLKYICEAGYRGKHRYVVAYCDLCGSVKQFRLENIIKGRVKSCGCVRQELVESGKLAEYSVSRRKDKPFLQKGGRRWREAVSIVIPLDELSRFNDETLVSEILSFIRSLNESKKTEKR